MRSVTSKTVAKSPASLWGDYSFGSLGPEEQDIFCEIEYSVIESEAAQSRIGEPIPDSLGFYVKAKDCQHIELFKVPEVENEQQIESEKRKSTDEQGTT